MSNPVAEALRAGLKAFGPNGENWVQGSKALDPPNCCVTLALSSIEPEPSDEVQTDAYNILADEIGAPVDKKWTRVGALEDRNDAPGRTFSEVVALYEKAIELAEAQS